MANNYIHTGSESPYNDDFESNKNYKRVLFKPSTAVQARELTQLQSSLQWQLASLGSYLFKDGTPVTGAKITYSINQPIMRFQNASVSGEVLVGLKYTGSNSNQMIQVTGYIEGTSYLLFSYLGAELENGETFTSTQNNTTYTFDMVSGSISNCVTAACSEGTLFIDGYFVEVPASHIVVDTSYNNAEIYNIGFNVVRSTVSAVNDSSLNDNASGSTNFNAPGADRYKISPTLVSYKDSEYENLDADLKANFVAGIVMQNDIVLKDQAGVNNTDLMDLLAKRTYDESGSYTVEDWKILLEDYRATEAGDYRNYYSIAIQPGSGYIQGYNVRNLLTEYVDNIKPRTSLQKTASSIYIPAGSYTLAKFDDDDGVSGFGFPDFSTYTSLETVALMSEENGQGTMLGTCTIYGFQRLNNNFFIYLLNTEDVRAVFPGGKSLASCTVDSATGAVTVTADSSNPSTSSFAINLYRNESGNAVLYGQETASIYPLNGSASKSAGSIGYYFVRSFSGTVPANSTSLQISDANVVFPTASNLITVIQNSGSGAGNHLDINKISVAPADGTVTLTSSLFSGEVNYTVVFAIPSRNISYRTKTAYEVTMNITFSDSNNEEPDKCYLTTTQDTNVYRYEDVEKVMYVRQISNFSSSITNDIQTTNGQDQYYDVTDLIQLERNQTDYTYENSYLYGFTGTKVANARGSSTSTTYQVKFVYYAHTGNGPFTVESYLNTNSDTDLLNSNNYRVLVEGGYYDDLYSAIPSYRDKNNTQYNLKDCLDFRVKRSFLNRGTYINGTTGTVAAPTVFYPAPDTTVSYRQSVYLPRYDVVYVTKDGTFGVKNGIPSENPQVPNTPEGALGIASIYNRAYMSKLSDGEIKYYDTKRYTMSDIGQISKRVDRTEQLLSMTLLEQNTINMNVPDENGLDRYKSGIFADDFSSFDNSDYTNELFDCTLDSEENCIRPQFTADNIPFVVSQSDISGSSSNANNIYFASDGITGMIPYTTAIYAQNLYASDTINLESMQFFSWDGNLKLTPSVDTWVNDLGNKPIKTTYQETPKPPTMYKTWKTYSDAYNRWFGLNGYTVAARNLKSNDKYRQQVWSSHGDWVKEYQQAYVAVENGWTLQDEIVKKNVVIDQYMRQRSVKYELTGMRPNVTVYATIDNIPITLSNTHVDTSGKCSGTFTIPKNVPCGQKVVVFKDTQGYASAEAKYTANGTTIWNDVNRTYIRNWQYKESGSAKLIRAYDPVAESFTIDTEEGIYIDSIDVYFSKVDENIPVGLYLTTCENGYPTENIIEMSDVIIEASHFKNSGGTALDSTKFGLNVPTNFKFDQPIYLASGTEYAFVVWSASYEYEIYISTLGHKDLRTQIGIAEQPFLGSMFTSQNRRTWTAEQMSDIKFRIHKCVFDTTAEYSNVFELDVEQSESYAEDPTTNFIPDYMCLVSNDFSPNNTSIKYEYQWSDDSDWTPFINHEEVYMKATKTIYVNDTSRASLKIRATLSTTDENLTPVLDLEQIYGIFVSNNVKTNPDTAFNYFAGTYVSRTVELENTANDLRVILDVMRNGSSDIDVYFKTSSYKPIFVSKTSETNDLCNDGAGASANIGNEMQVYYYVQTAGKLYPQSRCVISGYNNGKVYLNQVGNPAEFCGLNVSNIYVDSSDSELKVNGSNVTAILLLNEITDSATPIDISVLDTSVSTTIQPGTFVFHNNYVWKCVTQANSNSNVPSEISSYWKKVSGVKTVTAIATDNVEVEWRPMKKQTNGNGSSVDSREGYVEETYVPQIDLETEFTQFSIRIDLKCNLKYEIPTVKNLRAIAVI